MILLFVSFCPSYGTNPEPMDVDTNDSSEDVDVIMREMRDVRAENLRNSATYIGILNRIGQSDNGSALTIFQNRTHRFLHDHQIQALLEYAQGMQDDAAVRILGDLLNSRRN